jgi:hypothetical protein
MTDKLPCEEYREYHRRTGGDYATWRGQLADELDAKIASARESMTPKERAAASARGLEVIRELMGKWDELRHRLKD